MNTFEDIYAECSSVAEVLSQYTGEDIDTIIESLKYSRDDLVAEWAETNNLTQNEILEIITHHLNDAPEYRLSFHRYADGDVYVDYRLYVENLTLNLWWYDNGI